MTTIQEPVMTVDVRETAMRLAMSTEASQPWIVNWSGGWVRGCWQLWRPR